MADDQRGGRRGRGPEWRGVEGFGGGWQSGGIGEDAEFAGTRFDWAAVGSVGGHGVHIASASAPDYGEAGFGSSAREFAIRRQAQQQRHHDPHYHDCASVRWPGSTATMRSIATRTGRASTANSAPGAVVAVNKGLQSA